MQSASPPLIASSLRIGFWIGFWQGALSDSADSGVSVENKFALNQGFIESSRIQTAPRQISQILREIPLFIRGLEPFPESSLSPSYYVGEGTMVPSPLRRRRPALLNHHPHSTPGLSILALDLGTTTGWALHSREGIITSGAENFKPQRFEGGGMRYLRFKRWLNAFQPSSVGLDAVFFEAVCRHAGVDAAHAYGGFLAHLTAWGEHHRIPYQGVPVGTIKKHATGQGNASKAAVMAAMRARGFEPLDDNEADALALLDWALMTQAEGRL